MKVGDTVSLYLKSIDKDVDVIIESFSYNKAMVHVKCIGTNRLVDKSKLKVKE
jgi:hypothetical protein